jgi:hypothetical protein
MQRKKINEIFLYILYFIMSIFIKGLLYINMEIVVVHNISIFLIIALTLRTE